MAATFDNLVDQVTGIEIVEDDNINRTYRMDFENKRIIGIVDEKEALLQRIIKALLTRRYAYLIYDDQYGNDLFNKIGNEDLTEDYLDDDVPAMLEDCLLADEEVEDVDDVDFEITEKDKVNVNVLVSTAYGDTEIEGVLIDG